MLEDIIDENLVACEIEKYKDDLINNLRGSLKTQIQSMDSLDTLTLYLIINGAIIKEIKIELSNEYREALSRFLDGKEYGKFSVHCKLVFESHAVLEEVIANFYVSPRVKETISEILKEIPLERIKQVVSTFNRGEDTTEAIAIRIKKLLGDYDITSQAEVLIDRAFRDEVLNVLKTSGLVASIGAILPSIIAPLIVLILSLLGFNVTVSSVLWVLIPLSIVVIAREAFTFKTNVAVKVSDSIAYQVSRQFSDLNLGMVRELKKLIITSIVKFYDNTKNRP